MLMFYGLNLYNSVLAYEADASFLAAALNSVLLAVGGLSVFMLTYYSVNAQMATTMYLCR
jgi:hypothetical protein